VRTKVKRADELAQATNGTSSVQWIRADHIRIDPELQRQLRPEWVRWLAENWDENALDILKLSRRKDAYYCIDGQHRVFAARLRGEPTRLFECHVLNNLTKPQEAEHFITSNKNRKAVRLYDTFKVSLAYDPDSQAILKIVESVGLKLSEGAGDGQLNAVKACVDVYHGKPFRSKEPTPWALARSLRTLTGAWGMNRDAVSGQMILGAGAVHLRYGDAIDADLLARKLAKFNGGPLQVVSRAKIRRELSSSTVWRAIADVMVDIYNKGLRNNALPDFQR
jgi:hypothetical protein